MSLSRRSLFLITGALALRRAFNLFRGEPPSPPEFINADPVEVRIGGYGTLACDSPQFYKNKPLRFAALLDDDDHGAFDPPEPPRWERCTRRWARKHGDFNAGS